MGSDVYSYGVLLWSFYVGQQPFQIRVGLWEPNPLFPSFPSTSRSGEPAHLEYQALVRQCLREDPHERPTFAHIALFLERILGQGATTAPGPSVEQGTPTTPDPSVGQGTTTPIPGSGQGLAASSSSVGQGPATLAEAPSVGQGPPILAVAPGDVADMHSGVGALARADVGLNTESSPRHAASETGQVTRREEEEEAASWAHWTSRTLLANSLLQSRGEQAATSDATAAATASSLL